MFITGVGFEFESKLSGKGGCVSRLSQQHWIGLFPRRLHHVAVRKIATGLVFVHAGHDRGAAAHANRCRRVVPVEYDSGFRQAIKVWCLNVFVSIATHRVSCLVVSKQKDNIGPIRLSRRNSR